MLARSNIRRMAVIVVCLFFAVVTLVVFVHLWTDYWSVSATDSTLVWFWWGALCTLSVMNVCLWIVFVLFLWHWKSDGFFSPLPVIRLL